MTKATTDSKTQNQSQTTGRITIRSILLGCVFSMLFALWTVVREHGAGDITTATQIAVLPFILLFLCVVLLNPLLRLIKVIRPLTVAELMLIFVMGAVSSGVSTFGLASQLIPITSSLMNPDWNTEQTRWDLYIEPYVNESFFVAEEGLQEQAQSFRTAYDKWQKTKEALQAAKSYSVSKETIDNVQAKLNAAKEITDPTERQIRINELDREMRFAERSLKQSKEMWDELDIDDDLETVLNTYSEKLEALKAKKNVEKEKLNAMKEDAFEKVEVFRTGFPQDKRALPGFLPIPTDKLERSAWLARFSRLKKGNKAKKYVNQAIVLTESENYNQQKVKEKLDKAIELLKPLSRIPALEERLGEIQTELNELRSERENLQSKASRLRTRRQVAPASEFDAIDKDLSKIDKRLQKIQKSEEKLRKEKDSFIQPQLDITNRVSATIETLQTQIARLSGEDVATAPEDNAQGESAEMPKASSHEEPSAATSVRATLIKCSKDFRSFDASLDRFCFGDIKWSMWVKPLLRWGLLVILTYTVLMTLNVLLFRQWAYNERLVYPLAELPLALVNGPDDNSSVPPIFKNGLFWVGVAISVFVLSWNLIISDLDAQVQPISLTFDLSKYLRGSFLEAITPNARLHVFFTLIGLAFLVPAQISHSLWSFHLIYWLILLVLVGAGAGVNQNSFPANWTTILNFRTALGGGALIMFSSAVIWKSRKYLFSMLHPKILEELPSAERNELRISSWLFVLCSIGLVAVLTWGLGANLFYSILVYCIILVITIGLVRAVAEGGLLGFQCWFTPFHFIRTAFGMNHAWSAPPLFAPLIIFYTVLFLDIKTFIAPAMANALKIRDSVGMGRVRFHVSIALGIIIAAVIAVITHLVMAYDVGGDNMHGWFYSGLPKSTFDSIRTLTDTNPVDTDGGRFWLISGVVLMGALIFFRKHVFWLPHPIGLIMFVNPLMVTYWFSIFLGWLFKDLIRKYGNTDSYNLARYFFIGLMTGEIIMVLFGATLNRV